ncbi:MAG: T9SS type A sorting domain-containing protein [Bacteroidetes bacterium]|nr:T9SS type A sorting domain-containing protein [Bacteroidota bacterium]
MKTKITSLELPNTGNRNAYWKAPTRQFLVLLFAFVALGQLQAQSVKDLGFIGDPDGKLLGPFNIEMADSGRIVYTTWYKQDTTVVQMHYKPTTVWHKLSEWEIPTKKFSPYAFSVIEKNTVTIIEGYDSEGKGKLVEYTIGLDTASHSSWAETINITFNKDEYLGWEIAASKHDANYKSTYALTKNKNAYNSDNISVAIYKDGKQIGQDIAPTTVYSVSYTGRDKTIDMSDDGNRVAIYTGYDVRVYENVNNKWTLLGDALTFDYAVMTLSGDGNTLVIGDLNRTNTTRIFDYKNGKWNEVATIPVPASSIALSKNKRTLVIGNYYWKRVSIYENNGKRWGLTRRLDKKDFGSLNYQLGYQVTVSEDGRTVAFPLNSNYLSYYTNQKIGVFRLGEKPAEDLSPITLTGFNHDIIAEEKGKKAAELTSITFDEPNVVGSNNVLFTKAYRDSADTNTIGLPNNGFVTSENINRINYQLQKYDENNVLLLAKDEVGELVLQEASAYDKLSILSASANGASTFKVTVTYSDKTTEEKTFTVADWFNGNDPAIYGFGRINRTTDEYDKDVYNPRLYDSELEVNPNKVVVKLTFSKENSTSRTGIFAVCGSIVIGAPEAPVALEPSNVIAGQSFTANWQSVKHAEDYYIDIATDEHFTNLLPGYANKSTGNVTSLQVNTAEKLLYYRVRAQNKAGQSASSNTIMLDQRLKAGEYVTPKLTGFNADIIAEGTGGKAADVTNATFDEPDPQRADYVFFTEEFKHGSTGGQYGLPNNGIIESMSNPGVKYQLADYTADNALLLKADESGTLTLVESGAFDKLIILSASAEGESTFDVTVSYSDGTTQNKTFTVHDWFFGADPAIQGMGRVRRTTDEFDLEEGNPRLYDSQLDVDENKVVVKLSFKKQNSFSRTAIFAICGLTVEGAPNHVTALKASNVVKNTSFTANWEAGTDVNGYRIDVATDANFENLVGDYVNKDIGNVTSLVINTTEPTVYYRVRTYNAQGQSANSNTIVVDVAMGVQTIHNAQISIYPNPANNVLNIDSKNGAIEWLTIRDITGKVVFESQGGFTTSTLNIAALQPGIYSVSLGSNGQQLTTRFIKN